MQVHDTIHTSEMIHASSWGEPERAMHCWFVMAHKPYTVTAGIITACMSAVPWAWWAKLHVAKQRLYLVRTIVRITTTATQTLGLNFTLKSWAESLALMSVDYAWPTELPEDSLVSSPAVVGELEGYCQSAASAWKIPGAKTTQVNARMVTADHDRQGQAGHTIDTILQYCIGWNIVSMVTLGTNYAQ